MRCPICLGIHIGRGITHDAIHPFFFFGVKVDLCHYKKKKKKKKKKNKKKKKKKPKKKKLKFKNY
jgi:hypothetical protein